MKESEYIDLIKRLYGIVTYHLGDPEDRPGSEQRTMYQAKELLDELEEARRKAGTRIDYQKWLGYWNTHCKDLPMVRSLTKKRRTAIKKLCDDVGHDEAWEAYQLAVKNVADDPWWSGDNPGKKVYGFDNLVVHDKVMQKAESEEVEEYGDTPNLIPTGSTVQVMGWMTGTVEDSRVNVGGEAEYRVFVEGMKSSWFPARDVEERT